MEWEGVLHWWDVQWVCGVIGGGVILMELEATEESGG